MPPNPQERQDDTKKDPLDLGNILLPKKEVPGQTLDSASRVEAGTLVEQEQKAAQEGFSEHAPKPPPVTPPQPAHLDSIVKPLETFQGDIESVMQSGNVSLVTIAAAEAQRRAQGGESVVAPQVSWSARIRRYSMVLLGIVLLALAGGGLAYFILRDTTVPVSEAPAAPFIVVDETKTVPIADDARARDIMGALTKEKDAVSLSLGLIERLWPAAASTSADGTQALVSMPAQDFLAKLVPTIPSNLLRTLNPTFVLGVYVYDDNQPFLILSTDSYQEAFSGMLSWELHMKSDLAPLFTYAPSKKTLTPPPIPASGTSTLAATSSQGLQYQSASFVDRIVENHDARVLQNENGDIYLLWTFIDRNTIVIATSPATLHEIISRLTAGVQ